MKISKDNSNIDHVTSRVESIMGYNQPLPDRLTARSLIVWRTWGALFFCLAVVYLVRTPMNLDVAWLLYAAGRVMDGANLYVDIYEINPPLAVYFNFPAVGIARRFGWSEIPVFYGYVLSLAGLSLWLSRHLIHLIFENFSTAVRTSITLVLLFLFTLWPLSIFGQREHIVYIMTIPYVWAAIARAQGKPLGRWGGLLIGCIAGIGFSFKPYFTLVWLSVEGCLSLYFRVRKSWLRTENIAIIAVMLIYSFMFYTWESDYLTLVPLIRKVYFAYDQSIMKLVSQPTTLIWILAGIAELRSPYPKIAVATRILYLVATAFLATAYLQKKGWSNHMYPAMASSLLLLTCHIACRTEQMMKQDRLTLLSLPTVACVFLFLLSALGTFKAERNCRQFQAGPLPHLIPIVKQYAENRAIYLLSTNLYPSFPLVNYSGTLCPYHFVSLGLLPGFYHRQNSVGEVIDYHQFSDMDPYEKWMMNTVVADLVNMPPELLIVDENEYNFGMGVAHFDFIKYLSQDERFWGLMSHYSLLRQQSGFKIFKYKNAAK